MTFDKLCKSLEAKIQATYESGVTVADAERLSLEFLHAQIQVSEELKKNDLEARMRKSGLKAVRASVYMEAASKGDKKPTEAALAATVDLNAVVQGEQDSLDKAEVNRDALERYYSIFQNAQITYRTISKGSFGS